MRSKILFLVPYPFNQSPSQRFRFEQYLEIIQKHGMTYEFASFLDAQNGKTLFQPGKKLTKLRIILQGLGKRIAILFKMQVFDYVFIHREAAPVGPPLFEWLIARVMRKKIIYDFDDAIWLTDKKDESVIEAAVRWRSKVSSICKWAYKVSCGNHYLQSFALEYNRESFFIPSTIDVINQHNPAVHPKPKTSSGLSIGWTGSHSTLKYLKIVEPVLQRILAAYPTVSFVVIADECPVVGFENLRFIKWNPKTEIDDLTQIDIGIMPLPDDEWSKGKCGFKLLQYMALEIPAIGSAVGANHSIIKNGVNGYLCASDNEWETALRALIENSMLRQQMGRNGRSFVVDHYSVGSNTSAFLNLFA